MVTPDAPHGATEEDPWIVAEDLATRLPGVDGVVITADPEAGSPVEIQVLSEPGADRTSLRHQVAGVVREVTRHSGPLRVIVLEVAGPDEPSPAAGTDAAARRRTAEGDPTGSATAGRRTTWAAGIRPGPATDPGADGPRTPSEPGPARERIRLLGGERPVLVAADVRRRGGMSRATVLLTVGQREVTGTAERPPTTHDLGVVAEATLDAVRGAASTPRGLGLRGAALAEMLQGRVVCVRLSREEPTDRELFGAALVEGDDPAAATARATLDSLNRQL